MEIKKFHIPLFTVFCFWVDKCYGAEKISNEIKITKHSSYLLLARKEEKVCIIIWFTKLKTILLYIWDKKNATATVRLSAVKTFKTDFPLQWSVYLTATVRGTPFLLLSFFSLSLRWFFAVGLSSDCFLVRLKVMSSKLKDC